MKICMITRSYPPRIGGPGSMVQRLSKELIKNDFDISIVTLRIKGAPKFEIDDGIKIYREMNISDVAEFTPWNLGISIASMTKRIIQLRDHDVFHAHDISVAGFSGCLAKQIIDKPFFLKYGGDLVFEYLSLKEFSGWDSKDGLKGTLNYKGGFARLLHWIQRWYFKNYDMILPDSEYGKEHLIKNLAVPKEKVKVMPNVVDSEIFSPRDPQEVRGNLGLDGKIVFYVGRLLEWKGLEVLIKAFREVTKEHPDAKLLIGGEGPNETWLRQVTKEMELEHKIRFLGKISRSDLSLYLNACDVFVLPSYFDTTPNALLEAMACSKPCVVSNIDGIREVVKNNTAIVFPVADVRGLADSILRVLDDPKMSRELGRKARKRIEVEYSWKNVVKKFLDLYTDQCV